MGKGDGNFKPSAKCSMCTGVMGTFDQVQSAKRSMCTGAHMGDGDY